MLYTRMQRLEIGRQVYHNEITAKEAAEQYGISELTVMNYCRLYRDDNDLPRKQPNRKKVNVDAAKVLMPAGSTSLDEYRSMSKDELIQELVAARITEARLKKGYEVKGVGPDKEFIPLGNKNTK